MTAERNARMRGAIQPSPPTVEEAFAEAVARTWRDPAAFARLLDGTADILRGALLRRGVPEPERGDDA